MATNRRSQRCLREQLEYDPDSNVITFSPGYKIAITEKITLIDVELAGKCNETVRKELKRQRRQLAAELAAGHFCRCWRRGSMHYEILRRDERSSTGV